MSHKKKRTKKERGPTFVGFSPKVEPNKKERIEKMRKKYKKKGEEQ